ncbi:MAG: hypothetical protein ACRERD_34660 [Candidatus Binatia bacterium]
MVDQFVESLHLPIPQIRLERFRTEPACHLHMLTNYFWDIALAESLFPTLHSVELALRNTIHATLTDRYGTEEWWYQPYTLRPRQHAHVTGIEAEYRRNHGDPITPGRLVAELSFGFWVVILSFPYESRLWQYRRFRLVDQAFPYRAGVTLHDIHQRFNNIWILRNRVMHYEAIFDRPDLRRDHADIHEAIQWFSPDLHAGIHVVDRFLEVHQVGWERTYNKLHGMLGGP